MKRQHMPGRSVRLFCALASVGALSGALTGCAKIGDAINGPDASNSQAEKVTVTKTPAPTFAAKQVPLREHQSPGSAAKDDGLNVEWKLVNAQSGPRGGTVFTVVVKNLSDQVAIPPEALTPVKLSIPGNADVKRMQSEADGLDLPLGAFSTTTVTYTFNTTPSTLSNSKLQLGNVVFEGYLNI